MEARQRDNMGGGLFGWLRRLRGWPKMAAIILVSMPIGAVVLAAWLALVIVLAQTPYRTIGADGSLNLVIVLTVAFFGVPVIQRGQYRMASNRRQTQLNLPDQRGSSIVSATPPPTVDWPLQLRVRHLLMHMCGMAILIGTFGPFGHQQIFARFLDRFSNGAASRSSLARLVFDYGAMAFFFSVVALLTYRALHRRDAGLLNAEQTALLEAELNWLFSFGVAFVFGAFLCRWAGSMIMAVL